MSEDERPPVDLNQTEFRQTYPKRREPALMKGWWIGLLTMFGIFLFLLFVMHPFAQWWGDMWDTYVFGR